MTTKEIIQFWFKLWTTGDFMDLPLTNDFRHVSPFGTISGKGNYLNTVQKNRNKFLGYSFDVHEIITQGQKGSARYSCTQGDEFKLDVSKWYYLKEGMIQTIYAYYHIGEIKKERQIKDY